MDDLLKSDLLVSSRMTAGQEMERMRPADLIVERSASTIILSMIRLFAPYLRNRGIFKRGPTTYLSWVDLALDRTHGD